MRVAVYAVDAGMGFGNKRARSIAKAVYEGLRRCGVQAAIYNKFDGTVRADVAIAYGWVHEPVFKAYRAAGAHYAYWDLGYWNRSPTGHHRLSVNSWDTADHMMRGCSANRFARLGIEVQEPLFDKDVVLVTGMSAKAAGTHGFAPGEWEARTYLTLEEMRLPYKIVAREKPNKNNPPRRSIGEELKSARIVVTHHSNTAIDALVAGVPCFAIKGAGRLASPEVLDRRAIERPYRLAEVDRFQLLFDVAYAQWNLDEMRTGEAWQHIRSIVTK